MMEELSIPMSVEVQNQSLGWLGLQAIFWQSEAAIKM
jgi:hypothetical protein